MGFWDWLPQTVLSLFGGLAGTVAARVYVCQRFGDDSTQCTRAKGAEELGKTAFQILAAAVGLIEIGGIASGLGIDLTDKEKRLIEEAKEKLVEDDMPPKKPCLAGSCIYDINHLDKLYCIRDFLPPFLTKIYYRISRIAYKLHIIT